MSDFPHSICVSALSGPDEPPSVAGLRGRRGVLLTTAPGLIIVDAQRIFLDRESPAVLRRAEAVTARLLLLAAVFRARGRPVVFTRHVETPSMARGTVPSFFPRPITDDDPLSAIISGLAGHVRADNLLVKDRHDAFSRGLPQILGGVDVLFIAGAQTPLCVLSTALGLARHGIVPAAIHDACAARDPRAHDAAIRCLAAGHAHVRTTDEVVRAILFAPEVRDE
jgi:nicotinamidase-related amidase